MYDELTAIIDPEAFVTDTGIGVEHEGGLVAGSVDGCRMGAAICCQRGEIRAGTIEYLTTQGNTEYTTKWLIFCTRHLRRHFLEEESVLFFQISLVCS